MPEAPPRPSAEEQRERLTDGLVSDHANARYSGEILTVESTAVPEAGTPVPMVPAAQTAQAAQSEEAEALPPEPPPEPMPPKAAPVVPVVQGEIGAESQTATQQAALGPVPDLSGGGTLVAVIHFLEGSRVLTQSERELVADVVTLQRQRGGTLRVVGHDSNGATADGVAGEVGRFERSLDRANAVAQAMVEQGLPVERLEVIAAGASAPVYEEIQATGAAGNRRVEVFLR